MASREIVTHSSAETIQRGRAIGLWFTASSLAVVLTNALVPPLSVALGWQGAYHALGGATVVLATLTTK